jgi:hypothetical protein
VADVRRLRVAKYGPGYYGTLKHQRLQAGTDRAKALAAAIGRLRSAARLPLDEDLEVEVWGAQRFWAHGFATRLWLYYRTDPSGSDEYVELMAVRDHVHEQ